MTDAPGFVHTTFAAIAATAAWRSQRGFSDPFITATDAESEQVIPACPHRREARSPVWGPAARQPVFIGGESRMGQDRPRLRRLGNRGHRYSALTEPQVLFAVGTAFGQPGAAMAPPCQVTQLRAEGPRNSKYGRLVCVTRMKASRKQAGVSQPVQVPTVAPNLSWKVNE